MPAYIIGTAPAPGGSDRGSGPWCASPQTAEFLVYKRAMQFALDTRSLDISVGPDAVAHMRHFLNNTGNDYALDMAALMGKSAQLRQRLNEELALAKSFVEALPAGGHSVTSSRRAHGYFRQREDANLFFAIGGYAYWGQGRALITDNGAEPRSYSLDFEFHFYDRYNWDSGKTVSVAGLKVTDDFMQKFHQQCYAREFDIKGRFAQRVTWDAAGHHRADPVLTAKAGR